MYRELGPRERADSEHRGTIVPPIHLIPPALPERRTRESLVAHGRELRRRFDQFQREASTLNSWHRGALETSFRAAFDKFAKATEHLAGNRSVAENRRRLAAAMK